MEPVRPRHGSNSQRNKARGKGSWSQRKQEQAGGPLFTLPSDSKDSAHDTKNIILFFKGIFV